MQVKYTFYEYNCNLIRNVKGKFFKVKFLKKVDSHLNEGIF